jgi:hypothetical protein
MNSLLSLAAALPLLAAGPSSIEAMRWHHRVLVIAAPVEDDHALVEQRRLLAGWRAGAAERDLAMVEVIGRRVTGASDTGSALRDWLDLAPDRFAAVLVGKDGHVAMREAGPIAPAKLEAAIDAMPMRRAGQR